MELFLHVLAQKPISMKYKILLLGVFFSCLSFAQITQNLEKFREIKVFDGISVNLIKSDENKVVISGEDVNDVAVVNRDGRLKIRMEIDKAFNGYETFVEVFFTEDLDLIDVNENAFLASDHVFEQTAIELRSQEGAEMEVAVDVQKLNSRAITGGQILVKGDAINQDVMVNSGGQFNGSELITEQTEVSVNAGGQAKVNATEVVEAKVRAGGAVKVYGNPKILDSQKLFGGRIIKMD